MAANPKPLPPWLHILGQLECQVRGKIRLKHHGIRTGQAYTDLIKHYILFHGKVEPNQCGMTLKRTI